MAGFGKSRVVTLARDVIAISRRVLKRKRGLVDLTKE